mmetsp:Transcript_35484/g.80045  ORF Transcript_35484/g.80045 Transcript_35484/m.80045 type:complete len:182 (-) Transcript_35484:126-671(-)
MFTLVSGHLRKLGPERSIEIIKKILEQLKLVQAIVGTGAAASFFHANAYTDTTNPWFACMTSLSTIMAFAALGMSTFTEIDLVFLESTSHEIAATYLNKFSCFIPLVLFLTVSSMMLLQLSVLMVIAQTYPSWVARTVVGCGASLVSVIFCIRVATMRFIMASDPLRGCDENDSEAAAPLA